MRYTRLGPSSVLVRVLTNELGFPCQGFTPPFRVQGCETRYISGSKQQQQPAGCPKVLATTPCLKTGIQVAQNDRGGNVYHHKRVLCCFGPSSPFYGRFSVQKWPFWGCFQDDRLENSGRSLVCHVGVPNEGCCSSIAIGPSKKCKWVGNKASAMPWCHGVGNFWVRTSRF